MSQWTLGVLVGYPVAGLLLLAAIVTIVVLLVGYRREVARVAREAAHDRETYGTSYSGRPDRARLWGVIGGAVAIVVVSAAITIGSYPWKPIYHSYRPVEGTVEQVGSRILSNGDDGPSQAFVVRVAGVDYRVDDTRAAQLHEGDQVRLACRRTWEYAAAPGEVCRWGR